MHQRSYDRSVTDKATDTDHAAPGHSCAHCSSDDGHHALDEKGIVDSFRATLRTTAIVRSIVALSVTVSAALWAPLGIVAGISGWVVATIVGIGVVSITKPRYGTNNALVLGTVGSAAALPLLSWATATWVGDSLAVALAAGCGWLFITAVVEFLRDRNLLTILVADTREGEAARQGVMFHNPTSPWVSLFWSAFTAAIFGVWVWVIGLFPLAVFPLIPLQVVLALVSKKGSTTGQ